LSASELDAALETMFGVGKVKRGGAVGLDRWGRDTTLRREIVRSFKRMEAIAAEQEEQREKKSFGKEPNGSVGSEALLTAGRENSKKAPSGRPKGYATWRPHKKTRIIMRQVQEILVDYEEHLPLTVRQIFYRLVGAYGYAKTEPAYARLCDYLVRARRSGMISFDALRDDGLSVMEHGHYGGEEDFYRKTRQRAENYQQNKLSNQDVHIRVYCEAEGMMPQLKRVLEPYSVSVRSCSGFDSLSAKRELLRWALSTELYDGKLPVVLHLGDYDPDGEGIFEAVRDDLLAFLEHDDPDLAKKTEARDSFRRVALNEAQVGSYRLLTAPPKEKSSRTKNWTGTATCQLEAMEPDDLANILRRSVEQWLDKDVLKQDRKNEITARRELLRALPAGGAS
jgi:hypothetical protein